MIFGCSCTESFDLVSRVLYRMIFKGLSKADELDLTL